MAPLNALVGELKAKFIENTPLNEVFQSMDTAFPFPADIDQLGFCNQSFPLVMSSGEYQDYIGTLRGDRTSFDPSSTALMRNYFGLENRAAYLTSATDISNAVESDWDYKMLGGKSYNDKFQRASDSSPTGLGDRGNDDFLVSTKTDTNGNISSIPAHVILPSGQGATGYVGTIERLKSHVIGDVSSDSSSSSDCSEDEDGIPRRKRKRESHSRKDKKSKKSKDKKKRKKRKKKKSNKKGSKE